MLNAVKIAGKLENKPGKQINIERFFENYEKDKNYLTIDDKKGFSQYVSRGAYKIKQAYETFGLDFNGKLVLDIGASTGGFTDFALQHGARKVIAVDVGRGQLHYKLRNDARVVNIEEENFRNTDIKQLYLFGGLAENEKIDYVLVDLSFISILKILDKLKELVMTVGLEGTTFVFLLKPQFEAGKQIADKCRGVIKDDKVRNEIIMETVCKIEQQGFVLKSEGVIESPILGAKGNKEFLVCFAHESKNIL